MISTCPRCGEPFGSPEEKFCGYCGAPRRPPSSASMHGAPEQHRSHVPPVAQTAVTNEHSTSNLSIPRFYNHDDGNPSVLRDRTGEADSYGYLLPLTGRWRASILTACLRHPLPNCLMPWCLPCVTFSQINARLGVRSYQSSLMLSLSIWLGMMLAAALAGSLTCVDDGYYQYGRYYTYRRCNYGVLYAFGSSFAGLFAVLWLMLLIAQRSIVRRLLSLRGSIFSDCCWSFWCGCCSLAQLGTQVGSYKPGSCDFRAPPFREAPGYYYGGVMATPTATPPSQPAAVAESRV